MARVARLVVPGVAHHVTHRGNRRADIFADDGDRALYRAFAREHLARAGCRVWTYCLMTNHVHLLLVPEREDSLARGVGVGHQRYAQEFNRRHGLTGHLFEGRFFSTPLDGRHARAAARYVERNPVRAGMVRRAEDWPHSSARAHVLGAEDDLLDPARPFPHDAGVFVPWGEWLAGRSEGCEEEERLLRSRTATGRPCGDAAWVREVELRCGRAGLDRGRGRPPANAPGAADSTPDMFGQRE